MNVTELFDGYVSRTTEMPKIYFETEDEVEEAMIQAALFQTFDDVSWAPTMGRSISTFGNNLVIRGDDGTLCHTQSVGDPDPLRMSDVEFAMGNSGSLEGLVRDYIENNFTPEDEALLHGMTLNNHDVMLNPDGSVKVGCTEIPVEKLDKIAEASRRMRENQQSDEDGADEWVKLESHPLDLDLETGQPIRMDGSEYTIREIDPRDRNLPLKLASYGWTAFSDHTFEVRKEDM